MELRRCGMLAASTRHKHWRRSSGFLTRAFAILGIIRHKTAWHIVLAHSLDVISCSSKCVCFSHSINDATWTTDGMVQESCTDQCLQEQNPDGTTNSSWLQISSFTGCGDLQISGTFLTISSCAWCRFVYVPCFYGVCRKAIHKLNFFPFRLSCLIYNYRRRILLPLYRHGQQ
jgi:hypothetical protein